MQRAYSKTRSARLDWAITMTEATRGWRRRFWRAVKWYWELGI